MAKQVSGRRVYVTFIKGGTIVIQPSNCRGERYRMRNKGSIHKPKNISATELGKYVLKIKDACLT
jgi:DnaJ-class molecular chaperone